MKRNTLCISLLLILVYALSPTDWLIDLGLRQTSSFWHRLSYMAAHGSWLHLLVNVYSLLVLIFLSQTKRWQVVVSLAVSVLLPDFVLREDMPVVGISTFLYCLTGIAVIHSRRWLPLFALNVIIILFPLLLFSDRIAVGAHAWSFACGVFTGLLTAKKFALYGKRF